ncbi:Ig-like domain-containing protein [Streptomyces sp. NPDC004667]|uniref:L,D-transpeptidase n=1 Tax=Streptomyces sp. NPDC004667 TaxID=3154285 RepID=UPI0033B3E480
MAATTAAALALPATAHAATPTAPEVTAQQPREAADTPTVLAPGGAVGRITPGSGSTVGVGMPVSVAFDKPVTNEKAVQSAIQVTSTGHQDVVGHWFGRTRLDFRPRHYWEPDSEVTVRIGGAQNETVAFHIGRSQISTVDAETKTMTVVRDGERVKTFKVSAGAPDSPTYNGQMVISEKRDEMRMNGSTVGFTDEDGRPAYDIPDVPHAMRLSSSGTFIHGNYWGSEDVFGSVNTSHGCIGLRDVKGGQDPDTPGAWFYDHSLVGDIVVVTRSDGRTIRPDNGFGDWNLSWNAWTKGSAT